ncbi:uncharacterized protein LOC113332018 isoform X3 [Papaver somniferum]|uniref:uncharacterized protein LOC113332018 isoform X3 n=1 Tax=Papaver somniferum TaxID=3469 RepID=UPI000E700043|nr:uncharacterized protein LOC113332018 isoform X3 [Papaver somniferum]
MATPEYLWSPPFSDKSAVRLPILETPGDKSEMLEDPGWSPGCGFFRLDNDLAELYFIKTKNIFIGLESESSEFASLLLRMEEGPKDALLSIELVHSHYFKSEDRDTSKNRCLNTIVSFSESKYRHKFANCLELQKAKSEGFVITGGGSKGDKDGLMFVVYVHILRKKTDPGTYLSVDARSFMLACYHEEVTREVQKVCLECVASLEKFVQLGFPKMLQLRRN